MTACPFELGYRAENRSTAATEPGCLSSGLRTARSQWAGTSDLPPALVPSRFAWAWWHLLTSNHALSSCGPWGQGLHFAARTCGHGFLHYM